MFIVGLVGLGLVAVGTGNPREQLRNFVEGQGREWEKGPVMRWGQWIAKGVPLSDTIEP